MLEFHKITPKQRNLFKQYYYNRSSQSAENSFVNLCCYEFLYHGEYAHVNNNTLIVRVHFDYNRQILYYPPLGNMSIKEMAELVQKDAEKNNYSVGFILDSKELEQCCNNENFNIVSNRNMFEYLYLREDLMNLKGKKYQPKRNHINKFLSLYQHQFRILKKEDKNECMQMLATWRQQEMEISPELKRDYDDEQQVIEFIFDNFDELDIFAGALTVDNKMIAFSLGSPINKDTFDTHIEKADRNYQGSYAMINKEMASNMPTNFLYINREEDKGIMGLRQAKLSYQPYRLVEKWIAMPKNKD